MRALALALLVVSCGYRPLLLGESARLHVTLARSLVADAIAADEVVSGAREQLARDGALAGGEGYPRVVIEVLRIDEASAGVAASSDVPRARGLEIAVVARAWIVASAGGEPMHDTGDMRGSDVVAPAGTRVAEALQHADAVRAVARRIGARLARKVLGHAGVTDE